LNEALTEVRSHDLMGAMKEFLMWCEDKGYYEWSDLKDDYEWVGGKTHSEAMSEWMKEEVGG
tara:strand:+ start:24212 stop:24397 length:186 start_codon:yes stop_codon:yes gene_type:complete